MGTSLSRDGEKVLGRMLESMKFNPAWEAQQTNAASADAQQENDSSQQNQESAKENIVEDQRLASEMMADANERLKKIADQIDRKRENSVVGRLDVVDPQTATQYKVGGFEDYHYLTNDGYLYGMNSPGTPGSDLRAMIALP
jgi:hypothetical protein